MAPKKETPTVEPPTPAVEPTPVDPEILKLIDKLGKEYEAKLDQHRKESEAKLDQHRKESEEQRVKDKKEHEQKLHDQEDVLRKTINFQLDGKTTQPQAMGSDEIMKTPRMTSFDGFPCATYKKGVRSFLKLFNLRTRRMSDEEKAKHMITFFTGQVGGYAGSLITNAWDEKVPVVFKVLCKEIRIFAEGDDFLEAQLVEVTHRKQQPGESLTQFAYGFQDDLYDLGGVLDTAPTLEHVKFRIFVRLVFPEIREKMREYEKEPRNINAYVQKANAKGLGGFTRRVQPMESVKSTSAPFPPRAGGSFTPRASSRFSSDAQTVTSYIAGNGASEDDDSDPVFDFVQVYDTYDPPSTYGYDQPHPSGH